MPDILLVDDHSIVTTGLKLVIESFLAFSKIDVANDGDSAFEKIKHHNYDLIIMDITMPNTDSFGMVNNILSIKPETRLIMFSMNSEEMYAIRYFKMGAMGYLRKDAPMSEIRKAVEGVLNNKKYISPELSERLVSDLHSNHNSKNPFDTLSPREFEIVQHLANGDSVSEISRKLNLHTSTIGTHKSRIFEKLQCHNIIELSNLAKVHNIVFVS